MLEERDQIGEGLVKCQDIFVGGLGEERPEPVHHRVGQFVRNDVGRQAGEDHLVGQVGTGFFGIGAVVAEQNGSARRVEERIAALEGMRNHPQLVVTAPPEAATEVPLEPLEHAHADGVDDLLVGSRIAFGRLQAILGEDERFVEID